MTKLASYGGYTDIYDNNAQNKATANWNYIAQGLGRAPTMYLQYVDSEHPRSMWLSDQQWVISSWKATPWLNGVTPVVGLPMAASKASALNDFRSIANGGWDNIINGIFKSWKDAGITNLYLRPGWEMNGDWYPWGITTANAADFARAFAHIADLAHNYPGMNIKVVWNPNVGDPTSYHVPYSNYYPGDAYVDVIGIDSYGAPIDSDYSPDDNPTRPSDYTLRAAMDFAQSHGKPFAIPETGGANPAFPANLAAEIAARGIAVDFIGIWNNQDEYTAFNSPDDPGNWKAAFEKINASGGGTPIPDPTPTPTPAPTPTPTPTPTPPPDPDIVTRQTLTLSLSEDWYRGDPKFIAYIDGERVGSGTVYNDHGREAPNQFTFMRNLTIGPHEVRIDYINDYRQRDLWIEQVKFEGKNYLAQPIEMKSNGSFTITVDSSK